MTNLHMDELVIRRVEHPDELRKVGNLERTIWKGEDPVPVEMMVATIRNGGLVLGAFLEDKLIGFQYSFPGFDSKQSYLCSHSLGILKEYRSYGIGQKLKWAQRQEAKKLGYELLAWTYDPLETANANLNLRKLGGIGAAYKENYYGELNDILNAGIPSDRFVVHWWIQSDRVQKREEKEYAEWSVKEDNILLNYVLNNQELPTPAPMSSTLMHDVLFVAVPARYQEVKAKNQDLALQWRLKTREALSKALDCGYEVTDFVKTNGDIHYYVVTKK
ncbi:GNAT family N-acetyltransferase [Priestia flexa]|uniref:GNAT family N-acetyltransferase n=1 Tax=Priestia flexa TaxID=86664 RepID=UPI003F87B2E4